MKYRISATTIDGFINFYLKSETQSHDQFVRDLMRIDPPSFAMKYGTAFHEIVQDPELHSRDEYFWTYNYNRDGLDEKIKIARHIIEPAQKVFEDIRNSVTWEVKFVKEYKHHSGDTLDIVTKADGIDGDSIIEIKTTRDYKYTKYFNSCQWRFYLNNFELPKCLYAIFVIEKHQAKSIEKYLKEESIRFYDEESMSLLKEFIDSEHGCGEIEYLKSVELFSMDRYGGIENDCQIYINRFWDYIKQYNLEEIFLEKE